MGEVTTEDLRMRRFLLGELDERDREELEQRVLTEAGIRDKLLMAEDDLIEEYLEGFLKGEEREKFLRQFLSIPHQRDKLRIAKSLRRFSRDEANTNVQLRAMFLTWRTSILFPWSPGGSVRLNSIQCQSSPGSTRFESSISISLSHWLCRYIASFWCMPLSLP